MEQTKRIRRGLHATQKPRPRLEAAANPGSARGGLPAPDRSRYKGDLQWIPVLSAASFWVVGRWHDGNHIAAVGRIWRLCCRGGCWWWLAAQSVALRHVFVVPGLRNRNSSDGNMEAAEGAVSACEKTSDFKFKFNTLLLLLLFNCFCVAELIILLH